MITKICPPLTKEGNPYKPSRLGAIAGGLAGTYGAYELVTADTFIKNTNKRLLNEAANSKGFMNGVKNVSKAAGYAGLTAAAAAGLIALSSRLGGTLFDSAKNQERRDQADGEAAIMAKFSAAADQD